MRCFNFLIFVFLLFGVPCPAGADLYTYKDETGTLHAFEDASSVPEKYRSSMKVLPSFPGINSLSRNSSLPGSSSLPVKIENNPEKPTEVISEGASATNLKDEKVEKSNLQTNSSSIDLFTSPLQKTSKPKQPLLDPCTVPLARKLVIDGVVLCEFTSFYGVIGEGSLEITGKQFRRFTDEPSIILPSSIYHSIWALGIEDCDEYHEGRFKVEMNPAERLNYIKAKRWLPEMGLFIRDVVNVTIAVNGDTIYDLKGLASKYYNKARSFIEILDTIVNHRASPTLDQATALGDFRYNMQQVAMYPEGKFLTDEVFMKEFSRKMPTLFISPAYYLVDLHKIRKMWMCRKLVDTWKNYVNKIGEKLGEI